MLLLRLMEAPAWATQPQLISLNPSSGSGQSQTFALTVSEPAGAADIGSMNLQIDSSLDGSSGCWIYSIIPMPGSRCTPMETGPGPRRLAARYPAPSVEGDQARVASSNIHDPDLTENQFSWSIPVTFNANFSGAQTIYVYVANRAGFGTGYQALGTVTTP